jgi:RHS repeat-associated protein
MIRPTSSSWFFVASTVFTPFTFSMLLLTATLGVAQSTTGIVPYSSYTTHQYDTISNADLGMTVIASVRSKGGPIPFQANLVLNHIVSMSGGSPQVLPYFTLRVAGTGTTSFQVTHSTCPYQPPDPPPPTDLYHGFKFVDDTGAVHDYSATIKFDTAGCLNNEETTDATETNGSGLHGIAATNPDGSWYFEVADLNGNVIGHNSLVTDANGNTLSRTLTGGTTWQYTDSMGQIALTSTIGSYGPPHGADTYSYLDANGVNQTVSVNYSTYTQQTAWGCGGDIAPTSVSFPSSVSWPDGTSLSLTYEHGAGTNTGTVTGRIASLTLPTGGAVSYTYSGGSNGINCLDGSPATMTRTENGQTTTYVHTTINANYQASTVETLPDGGRETFLFSGHVFGGNVATTLYSDVVTDSTGNITSTKLINFNGNPNGSQSGYFPTSKVDTYVYRGGTSVTAGSVHSQTSLDATYYALPLDVKVYTPATSSAVYTDTVTTYGSFSNGSCSGATVANRICTSVTSDGSGNTLKSSRATYDLYGNKLNGSTLVSGTTYLSSGSATYNSNGTVATSTSTFGNVSTNSVTSCDNTLPTSASNGVATYTYAWDCNGGVMNSVNNSIGTKSFVYNDPLYRATQSTDENGTAVNYSFAATSGEGTMTFGSSTVDGIVNVDGFGHKASTQVKNGSSYDTTSHTYLGNHVASDSLPCSAALSGTCATTKYSYSYDSVGRLSVKTDATTSATRVYSYTANDTLVTVSGGTSPVHKVQTEVDGLGRLISVCEITTLPGSTSCNQTASAAGFLTAYQYTPMGLLSTVTQFANGSSPQTRTFTYDNIGRKLTESTPEGGLVQFFYDTAPSTPGVACPGTANGKLVKRYDARGNTTCYAYDSFGRTSSVVYSGPGSTGVNKYFTYDAATVNGQTMLNAKEKMAEAYTSTSVNGTKLTDFGFSYSVLGQVTDLYESTPHSGGYYHTTAAYYSNGAVATLGGVPGKPTWSLGLDPMGRFKTLSETSNCNGTCLSLISSAFYSLGRPITINYGSGDHDSFVYSAATGMESSYTLKQGANSIIDTITWFPTGQLSKQVFTDTVTPANAQTCTYSYDDLLRLASDNCGSAWSQTFAYDPFGNIVKSGSSSFAATYNGKNRIATLGSNVPTYDASGNLLTINTGTLHTYTWDAENRVASIDGKTLTYDALDRVVEEGTTLQILYGPTGKLGVQSGQTNTRTYLGLPKGAGIIYDGSSVVYQHPDLMGNGILGTNNTQGKVFDRFFAPFGEEYKNSGSTVADFTGKTQDLDPNLYDFPYREDSPVQGRWLNPDPSGISAAQTNDPQTLNRYSYVRNSAMGMTDPNGLRDGVWAYVMSFTASGGLGGINDNGGIGWETADQASAEQLSAAREAALWVSIGAPGASTPLFGNNSTSGNGTTQQDQQQQTSTAPANSRTDVVLYGREVPPEPQPTGYFWEMDWYAGSCSDTCSQSSANTNQTISLVESLNGGSWLSSGTPKKGEAEDQISPDAKTFNQRWFVADPGGSPKQVQIVVGRNGNGNWITTWEVHVIIDKAGDRPLYSPVP